MTPIIPHWNNDRLPSGTEIRFPATRRGVTVFDGVQPSGESTVTRVLRDAIIEGVELVDGAGSRWWAFRWDAPFTQAEAEDAAVAFGCPRERFREAVTTYLGAFPVVLRS